MRQIWQRQADVLPSTAKRKPRTYDGISGGGRLTGMFPIGVGLGPMRVGTDGAGLVGAAGA